MAKLAIMKKLILLLFIPLGAIGQNKGDLIKITDMLQMKQMSGLSFSPD